MAEILELAKSFHHTANLLEKLNGRIQEHLEQSPVSKAGVFSLTSCKATDIVRMEERNKILLEKLSDIEHKTNIISARFDELKKRLSRHICFRKVRKREKNFGKYPKEEQSVWREKSAHIKLIDGIPQQRKADLQIPVKYPPQLVNYESSHSNIDLLYSQIASDTSSILLNQSQIASLCSSKLPPSLAFETLLANSGVSELKSMNIQKSVKTQTDFSFFCGHCQMVSPLQSEDKYLLSTVSNFEAQSPDEPKSVSQKVCHACGTHVAFSEHVSELDEKKSGYHFNKPINISNGEGFVKNSTQHTEFEVSSLENKNLEIQTIPSTYTKSKFDLRDTEYISLSNQTMEYVKENVENMWEVTDPNIILTGDSCSPSTKVRITDFNQVPKNTDYLGTTFDFKNSNIVSKGNSTVNMENSHEESKLLVALSSVSVLNEKAVVLPGHVEDISRNDDIEVKKVDISASYSNVKKKNIDVIEICDSIQELNSNIQQQSTEKMQYSVTSMDTHKKDEVLVPNSPNSDMGDKTPILKELGVFSCKETGVNNDICFEDSIGIKRKANFVGVTQNASKCKEKFPVVLQKSTSIGMEPLLNLSTGLSETDDEEEEAGSYIPFTATAAFQRLAGNIPIKNKVQMRTITETDSESDDEIEKAISTAMNSSITGTSIDHDKSDYVPVEEKPSVSAPDGKTSYNSPSDSPKRKSSLKPTSKIKETLSKATISALGLSSDSDIDPGSSSSKKKADEEDSDEFDFYD